MNKEMPLNGNGPQPDGRVFVHYAGTIGRAKECPGAWPGARMSTDCDANCDVGHAKSHPDPCG